MKCLLIAIWHMPYDVLPCADPTVSLQSLKTHRQLITFEPSRIAMRNLPASAWYRWHELPLRSIRIVSSNARLNKLSSFILRPRQAERPGFFDLQRSSPLSGLSQYGFDQVRDACAAPINLCHLFQVPVCRPQASWHPYEAGRLTAT